MNDRQLTIETHDSQAETGLGLEELSCEPNVKEALRQFRLIFGTFHQHFRKVQPGCGTSAAQVWVLAEVTKAPGIGISELSRKLGIRRSTGSLMVGKMVQGKLLSKRSGLQDQRRVQLYVTAMGQKVLATAQKPPEGALPKALSALSRVELETLSLSLMQVIAKLELSD
jgi:MarR family transcriptional regulator, organic hydroperoxide resistance regulator